MLFKVIKNVDEIAMVDSSDAANMVDINEIDLDDEEIPQFNQSDLERLKDSMTDPLSPSQKEFLQ